MFYAHLWGGVLVTVLLLVVAVTGIMLNHKRAIGLMPEAEHRVPESFAASLPLPELAARAAAASGLPGEMAEVDRMDVRPGKGLIKVRFSDPATTEVTLDLASGAVLLVGERGDVFIEQLHSGEAFGDGWILLSDVAAVGIVLLLISGYWLWLAPRWRRR